jgi:hypothetical protein
MTLKQYGTTVHRDLHQAPTLEINQQRFRRKCVSFLVKNRDAMKRRAFSKKELTGNDHQRALIASLSPDSRGIDSTKPANGEQMTRSV